ncbi:MAG TPA: hypothetical protein VGK06_10640 [Methanosarcina sp.]
MVDQEKIHNKCLSENPKERRHALEKLTDNFLQLLDKQQAWNELIGLTYDENSFVRSWAASLLGTAFSDVPDKQQAWDDLHRLTTDEDRDVRSMAADALGSVFSQVPDKQQAWNDLRRLTTDEDRYVRVYSNHALGKVSISKASQAKIEEDYKKELEKAISFFEKAAQESHYLYNPSKFCLPFYRSFYTILFKRQEAREEVNKYLEEAKSAIEGSKSKELLFEAVENLAEALKEVQSLGNLDLETKKDELNFYRKYCEHAIELLMDTEETAPFTIGTIRKGLPFLDKKLKNIIQNHVLEKEISDHIKKSSNWFRENFIGLNGNQDKVYGLKYFSPAYFQSFLNNGKKLFISKSPGFTWGDGVYLTSIKNPYSSMMYGSIGVMGWIDTEDIENVYDACSPEGIELYQRWIAYTKGLYSYLTTTVHADWANRLLRNKFRKVFKIDIVVFHPDQYNMKYCDKKQDFWFLVSDWVSGRPPYSKKIEECKPLVIVGENFEKIGSGRLFSDLIGKNFVSYTYHFHAPPSSKGRPNLPLITSLIAFHSHNDNIIIVRP